MRPGRDDTGMALPELIVAMVVSAFLFGMVLTTMTASLKLIKAAPSDTNPHTFGALAAAGRLEARIVPNLECANPAGEATRSGCVDIRSRPAAPRSHTDHAGVEHVGCWVVAVDAGRRLACWELLAAGDVVALLYPPDASITNPATLLDITAWAPEPAATLPVAGGVAHLRFNSPERAWEACAAIRDDQRQLLADTNVPFCDGPRGVLAPDTGAARSVDINGVSTVCTDPAAAAEPACTVGYPMPAVRIRP